MYTEHAIVSRYRYCQHAFNATVYTEVFCNMYLLPWHCGSWNQDSLVKNPFQTQYPTTVNENENTVTAKNNEMPRSCSCMLEMPT